jgi:hypothetical protein
MKGKDKKPLNYNNDQTCNMICAHRLRTVALCMNSVVAFREIKAIMHDIQTTLPSPPTAFISFFTEVIKLSMVEKNWPYHHYLHTHFTNSTNYKNYDTQGKPSDMSEILNKDIQKNHSLSENPAGDKIIILFSGRVLFKQYITSTVSDTTRR